MGMNKVVSFQSPLSGAPRSSISVGFIGKFASSVFQPCREWAGLEVSPSPKTADVIVYSFGSSPSFHELDNRGTPVIVVDEGDSPGVSPELLRLLRCPEVRLCFRKYGFRDPQAYFRCDDYYEEVYRRAAHHDAAPDHFSIHDDDPLGNAIRKIRVSLPVCDELPDMSDLSLFGDRGIDILFIESHENDQMNALRGQWEGLPGAVKRWITGFTFQQNFMPWFEGSKIFVSDGLPSSLDLCAFLNGCVVIKPECSNVHSSLDIYDPTKLCVWNCDATFKELPDIISYVLNNISECEERVRESRSLLLDECAETSWAMEFREVCMRAAHGDSRLGDIVSALPLGK